MLRLFLLSESLITIRRAQRQICGSETKLFEDVEGVYQKLMGASWSVDSLAGFLVGKVNLYLTEPLTEEEAESAAEKIEMINSTYFPIRLKHWSVLTDEGLLFVYMRDEDGDYDLSIVLISKNIRKGVKYMWKRTILVALCLVILFAYPVHPLLM